MSISGESTSLAPVARSRPKRAFDVALSVAALIALTPLIVAIAIAVKIEDRGPVLFVQDRVGLRGRLFRCLKFRTMVVGAESKGSGIEVETNDARITRVGGVLRRWTLDEIPQLVNVLRGEMSIVGPRPTVASQVAAYSDEQRRRLEARPGMSGWAWIHGRNAIPWEDRIELDIWYVDHWSMRLDLEILLKAAWMLIRREGVYGADGTVRGLASK